MNTFQLFLIFTLFSNLASATFNQLAFSGGGAFGAVEIGILKRINELNPKKYNMYTYKKDNRINTKKDKKLSTFMGWIYISCLNHNLNVNN